MPTVPLKKENLTKAHLAFIESLADPDDFRTIGEKAEAVGYNAEYGRQLSHDPKIAEMAVARCREMVRGKLPQVHRYIVRDATNGKAEAIDRHRAAKIVFQATGEIQPGGVTINDNRSLNIAFPERLAGLFGARRETLREVGIVEARTGETDAGGSKKGNGHGNGDSTGD